MLFALSAFYKNIKNGQFFSSFEMDIYMKGVCRSDKVKREGENKNNEKLNYICDKMIEYNLNLKRILIYIISKILSL